MVLDRLFLYGSLRRDCHPMARWLARRSTPLGHASVPGVLYLVADYPGLVLDPAGGPVVGELLRLGPAAGVLRELDRYEGCRPGQTRPHEFVRRRVRVTSGSGEAPEAWIYLYNREVTGLKPVPGGDFLSKPVRYMKPRDARLRR